MELIIFAVIFVVVYLIATNTWKETYTQDTEIDNSNDNSVNKQDVQEELTNYLQENFWDIIVYGARYDPKEFEAWTEDSLGMLSVSNEPSNFLIDKLHLNRSFVELIEFSDDGELNCDNEIFYAFSDVCKDKLKRPLFAYRDFYFNWTTFGVRIPTNLGTYYVASWIDSIRAYSFRKKGYSTETTLNFYLGASAKTYPKSDFEQMYIPIEDNRSHKVRQILETLIKYNANEWKKALVMLIDQAQKEAEEDFKKEKQGFTEILLDNEGNVDLTPNIFQIMFDSNKEQINTGYREYVADLTKVKSFINAKDQIVRDLVERIINSTDSHALGEAVRMTIDSMRFQDTIIATGIEFMTALFEDDFIKFHEIKDLFERLGVFNSTWQKDLLDKMGQIDGRLENIEGGLVQLNSTMKQFENRFIKEVKQLQLISAQGIVAVSQGLEKLGNKMDTSNAIAAVNAYQNYQTKRALKQ